MVSPKLDPEVLEFEKNCVFFRNFGEKPKAEGTFFGNSGTCRLPTGYPLQLF